MVKLVQADEFRRMVAWPSVAAARMLKRPRVDSLVSRRSQWTLWMNCLCGVRQEEENSRFLLEQLCVSYCDPRQSRLKGSGV